MAEFDLIRDFFTWPAPGGRGVALGVGDDAAVLDVPPGWQLVAAIDTLVEGVHFPAGTPPRAIGHKALAVNLSDLAAMGAEPAWFTLALTLPGEDRDWVAELAAGMRALAEDEDIALVGGDTTRGPLTLSIQVLGLCPAGEVLTRRGARAGDRLCVSGYLGDAGLGLRLWGGDAADTDGGTAAAVAECRRRLAYPSPRLALGRALRGVARSAIDISDGLLADLGHLLEADGLGATLEIDTLPRSPALRELIPSQAADWQELPLSAGDDYELLFAVGPGRVGEIRRLSQALGLPITVIGTVEAEPGLRCRTADGADYRPPASGYRHFHGS